MLFAKILLEDSRRMPGYWFRRGRDLFELRTTESLTVLALSTAFQLFGRSEKCCLMSTMPVALRFKIISCALNLWTDLQISFWCR